LHKNALSQKRSEYRPLGWKNFGECSIRLRWSSQNLGSFLLMGKKFSNVELVANRVSKQLLVQCFY
jgi:hypothetical protein